MKSILIATLTVAGLAQSHPEFLSAPASRADVPLLCRYGEYDGQPIATYRRVEQGPDDWYSQFKMIQICGPLDGSVDYVLSVEELIRGFQVVNPPRYIAETRIDSAGNLHHRILNNPGDHPRFDIPIDLYISRDGKRLDVETSLYGKRIFERMERVWSISTPDDSASHR